MCNAALSLTSQLSSKLSVEEEQEQDVCWICLGPAEAGNALLQPCRCPSRMTHATCLGRWQLQRAGSLEESNCRFCEGLLPDWKEAHADFPKATPIMTIVYGGVTHQIPVTPGPAGRAAFQHAIRGIYHLEESDAVQLSFGCRIPGTEHEIILTGWDSFDAAVHCASISAGQRQQQQRAQQEPPQERPARHSSGGRRWGFFGNR